MSFMAPPEDSQILLVPEKVKASWKFSLLGGYADTRRYGFTPDLRKIVIMGHQFVKAD
jgi:hypothetical protein